MPQDIKPQKTRIWELDFFRGIALIFMIYFHIVFDLREIYGVNITYSSGINFFIGKASVILFMFISGISCSFSKSNVKRGLRILFFALILTIVTHLYGEYYGVKFGVLHFFAFSLILSPLFLKINRWLLIICSFISILFGLYIGKIVVSVPFLFPFGLEYPGFTSSDYYPLFPWIGIFLFGMAFEKFFYKEKSSFVPINISRNNLTKMLNMYCILPISFVGRKTLLIYLLHQPIISGLLWLIFTQIKAN